MQVQPLPFAFSAKSVPGVEEYFGKLRERRLEMIKQRVVFVLGANNESFRRSLKHNEIFACSSHIIAFYSQSGPVWLRNVLRRTGAALAPSIPRCDNAFLR